MTRAQQVIASIDEVGLFAATSTDLVALIYAHFPELPSHSVGRLVVLLAQVEADAIRRSAAALREAGAVIPRNREERRDPAVRGGQIIIPRRGKRS